MKKRIFVAIPISEDLQNEILEWEKEYMHIPVRWLLTKNLHITVIPPWYEENIHDIKDKLKEIQGKFGSLQMEFRDVNYGPNPKRPRLIWASGTTPKKLLDLKKETEGILKKESENRPFLLHLTLARFREEHFDSFPVKEINKKVFWRDFTDSVVLMESHLSRGGADYEILESIKL